MSYQVYQLTEEYSKLNLENVIERIYGTIIQSRLNQLTKDYTQSENNLQETTILIDGLSAHDREKYWQLEYWGLRLQQLFIHHSIVTKCMKVH